MRKEKNKLKADAKASAKEKAKEKARLKAEAKAKAPRPEKPAVVRRDKRAVRRSRESDALYERAKKLMPGGVSSPVRSFNSVGGNPFYVKKGKGCFLVVADGKLSLIHI